MGFNLISPRMVEGLRDRPLLILILGQSNAANSNPQAQGGDLVVDDLIKALDDSAFVVVNPTTGAGVHAVGYNNLAFQMAKRARRDGYGEVFIVQEAVGGATIDQFIGTGPQAPRYTSMQAKMNAALSSPELAAKAFDFVVIWMQGESNGGPGFELSQYGAQFGTLKGQLRSEPWWKAGTQIVCGSMPPLSSARIVDAFFVNTLPNDDDPYTVTADLRSFTAGADQLHWTGEELDEVGARFYDTWRRNIAPATPTQDRVASEYVLFSGEHVNGRGLGIRWDEAPLQGTIGVSSYSFADNQVFVTPASLTFDSDDGFVRANGDFFVSGHLECLSGLTFDSQFGSAFVDVTNAVNTSDGKKAGTAYFDAANNRLIVATGPADNASWVFFNPAGAISPV
ncbi:hypothetical protein GCM10007385_35610 [Tateyamaria omphalii]|uniref:sialate O-acetylesterase n=1 Tax=Tateyamaria omphalii TaxID=299262 RepID=UPI001675768F|nr:sialate O-acetylesterase [Tateyamaria omphalii]GGX63353.1 hypothetical protein GCM10007385_35610 [Tateyamaria omphalii]